MIASTPAAFPRLLLIALFFLGFPATGAVGADPVLLESIEGQRYRDDLPGLERRGLVRVLVVYSKSFFFIDQGRERGMTAEALRRFETLLNARLGLKKPEDKIRVVAVPVFRDELIPGLLEGRGDIAAANLTITPERTAQVDFARSFYDRVNQIVVTGKHVPGPQSVDDLSGEKVFVRPSSSYHDSLVALNRSLAARGRKPVRIEAADERLEDEDLLEMVNAGLLPRIVVDDYLARLWAKVFSDIRIYPKVAVASGERIAWAMRKQSPHLKAAVDAFVARNREGSAIFNETFHRYLRSTRWVKNAASREELTKFDRTVDIFKKYGERYGFDYLMMTAQGYQESQLDQQRVSPVGAVGVMQLMPQTGEALGVGDIRKLEPNVHGGVKYMRKLIDDYFSEPGIDPLNQTLFAFAAYNAGPARVAQLRAETAKRKLDPNRWFNNVEQITGERIGRQTVQYVANIYKYYIAYKLVAEERQEREQLEKTHKQ
jgi:membrane-bound lytic murein transglycosylase MltF